MRLLLLLHVVLLVVGWPGMQQCLGEDPQPVSLATHHETLGPPSIDAQAVERIRKIVLHQDDNPRALAHLVQLTRGLDAATAAQLFADLADDHLRRGKNDQAANFLKQLLIQYPTQPAASAGLLKLVQLYSSSEINYTQQTLDAPLTNSQSSTASPAATQQAFCKYALRTANNALPKNPALKGDFALSFQRAVTARGAGRAQLAQGLFTRLKHNAQAEPWRTYARVEQWLQEDREGEPPLPVMICRHVDQRPHLDGALTDAIWQSTEPVQLAYDDEFLYLAVRYSKVVGAAYEPDPRPRTHDAVLAAQDHVRLRLDLDRDYATYFELAVDHRGWTADRCWQDASWNPQWFVAAGGDASTWTVEVAIPWEQLTSASPLQRTGEPWAIQIERVLPNPTPRSPIAAAPSPAEVGFRTLLFQ